MAQYSKKLAKGVLWFFKFDFNGTTHRSNAIYKSKQEAKKAEAQKLSEIDTVVIKAEKIPLKTAVDERLKYLKLKSSSKHHCDSERYLNIIRDYFGDCFINDITKENIHTFIMEQATYYYDAGKKNYSINASIRCYKALFNFINENYQRLDNPFYKFKFFPVDKNLKYIPSDEEINRLLSVCNPDQTLLVRFVMETGCRINEALNFSYSDIIDNGIVLYTRKSHNANRTPRKLPIPDCLKNVNIGKYQDRVFISWTERPKFLEKKLKMLGLKVWGWHNLRHRFASILSKNGVPLFEIMSKLGHQNLETTQKYLQLIGG